MLIRDIIKEPAIRVLEKDDIWKMVDYLYLRGDSSDDFDLENNSRIKVNILMDEWEENEFTVVYTVLFDEIIIGVGGYMGDGEDEYGDKLCFMNAEKYKDMITYLYTLKKLDFVKDIKSLDYDFKL
jgi:hypothetical protein